MQRSDLCLRDDTCLNIPNPLGLADHCWLINQYGYWKKDPQRDIWLQRCRSILKTFSRRMRTFAHCVCVHAPINTSVGVCRRRVPYIWNLRQRETSGRRNQILAILLFSWEDCPIALPYSVWEQYISAPCARKCNIRGLWPWECIASALWLHTMVNNPVPHSYSR